MAQSSSGKDGAPESVSIWDRIHALGRRGADIRREETPKHRGTAVSVAILVSTLLWFSFTMRESHMRIVSMPTTIVNLPDGQSLSQLPPSDVRVQVVGDGWSLLRLHLRPPTIPINASLNEIVVRDAIPELPKNVEIQSVSPSVLHLWKEGRITRRIPVQPRVVVGTPPTHDLVDEPRLQPDSVEISGAVSVVEGISAWPTEVLHVEDVRDSLEVRLALSDTLAGLVTRSIEAAMLRAVAQPFTEGWREIEVTVQGQPTTLVTLEPTTIRVRYRVPFAQYREALDAMDFYATVSYDEIRSDTTGRVRPTLHLPEGILLRDVEITPPTLGYYERID